MSLHQTIRRSSLNRSLQFESSSEDPYLDQFNQNYENRHFNNKISSNRSGRMLWRNGIRNAVSLETRQLDESKSLAAINNPLSSLSSNTQAKSIHSYACVSLDPQKYTKPNKKPIKNETLLQAERVYGCSSGQRVKIQPPCFQVSASSKEKKSREEVERLQSKILSEGARGYDTTDRKQIEYNGQNHTKREDNNQNISRGKKLAGKKLNQPQLISSSSSSNNNSQSGSTALSNHRCTSMRNLALEIEEENLKGTHQILEELNSSSITNLHIDLRTIKLESQKEIPERINKNSTRLGQNDSSRDSAGSHKEIEETKQFGGTKTRPQISALPSFSANELKYINSIRNGKNGGNVEDNSSSNQHNNSNIGEIQQLSCRMAAAHRNSSKQERYQQGRYEGNIEKHEKNNILNLYGKKFELPRQDIQMISTRGRQLNSLSPQAGRKAILTTKSMSLCEDDRKIRKYTQNLSNVMSNQNTINYQDSNDESTAHPSFLADSPNNPQDRLKKQLPKRRKIIKNVKELLNNQSDQLRKIFEQKVNQLSAQSQPQSGQQQPVESSLMVFQTQQSQYSQQGQKQKEILEEKLLEKNRRNTQVETNSCRGSADLREQEARNQAMLLWKITQCFQRFKQEQMKIFPSCCTSARSSEIKEECFTDKKEMISVKKQLFIDQASGRNISNQSIQKTKQFKLQAIGLSIIQRFLRRKGLMMVFIELIRQNHIQNKATINRR